MKSLFSIGEVSKIYGLSVQALRHYHKIGLVVPKSIDQETGYRYYTFDQFQFISRLKYLQSLGLSLEEIREILSDGDAVKLKKALTEMRAEKERELYEIRNSIEEIDWTIGYYSYIAQNDLMGVVYKRRLPERHVILSDSLPGDTIEEMDVSLHSITHSEANSHLRIQRQYGYVLDFESLLEAKFNPLNATLFIYELPPVPSPYIQTLPAGSYLCYCARILSEDWCIDPVREYLKNNPELRPSLVIAAEYEDNLREYYNAQYEIQILFSGGE